MKNLIEYLLNHIVAHPEDVRVEETESERGFLYTIYVHAEDMGKIIGRNGNVIQAIRTLAKVRAVKEHIRAQIVIAEQEDSSATTSENAAQEADSEVPDSDASDPVTE